MNRKLSRVLLTIVVNLLATAVLVLNFPGLMDHWHFTDNGRHVLGTDLLLLPLLCIWVATGRI